MKNLLIRLSVFFIPVILICGMLISLPYKAGEIRVFDVIIEQQRMNPNGRFGMAYNEQNTYYKLANANYYKSDVISLGASRVMQFKSDYFKNKNDFYNCGGAFRFNFDEALNFIKSLEYTPRVVILNCEQWTFNDNYLETCRGYDDNSNIQKRNPKIAEVTNNMISDILEGKYAIKEINNYSDNIGITGRVKGSGFQNDGSYYYNLDYKWVLESGPEKVFENVFGRIETGDTMFAYGSEISGHTLKYLEELLEFCNENNIEVIGFIPPIAPMIYDRMMETGNYSYIDKIIPEAGAVFERYGYNLIDYTDVRLLGLDDYYFVDGFHGSEVLYGSLVRDMIQSNSTLGEYIDDRKLDEMISGADNYMTFYSIE